MSAVLSARERMQACIAGDPVLDRPPVVLWRHFPVDDQEAGTLAQATLDFQAHYHFDVVKVSPSSSYCLLDWGAEDIWEGNPEGSRRFTRQVIQSPEDWENLPVLDPHRASHLQAQLDCLRMLRTQLDPELPMIQTVFSPLAQAKNLAGAQRLLEHIHSHPNLVRAGLQQIAETTRRFILAAMETGIDGIFYAVQHAQEGVMSLPEYQQLGVDADRIALAPAAVLWCNFLHLHGTGVHLDLVASYPGIFQVVNWHDREGGPSLQSAQMQYPGVVCGGVSQRTISLGERSQVYAEARSALEETRGKKVILGTGCVTPVITPHGNICALLEAARTQEHLKG